MIEEQVNEMQDRVPCEYIPFDPSSIKIEDFEAVQEANYGPHSIKYITQMNLKDEIEILVQAKKNNVDILPGRYEGGFKAWECSFDLAKFLIDNGDIIHLGDTVLELGCGVGLPGLAAYQIGADVTFQDYNKDVLNLLTIPNVKLNAESAKGKRCKFLCGDWEDICKREFQSQDTEDRQNKLFDVILTSETLYEKNSFSKLINLMKAALKPSGKIYVASKVHYFGNGAGLADFEALVKREGHFKTETVLEINDQGLAREIIKLTHRQIS